MSLKVHYFSTKNVLAPFVAMIGPWNDRAMMVKTVRGGTKLGTRDAIKEEIELYNKSTRCIAVSWSSVRDLLWDHQADCLINFYPGLVASIRKHSDQIKRNLGIVKKKQVVKNKQREADREIARANRLRQMSPETLPGFQSEFEVEE